MRQMWALMFAGVLLMTLTSGVLMASENTTTPAASNTTLESSVTTVATTAKGHEGHEPAKGSQKGSGGGSQGLSATVPSIIVAFFVVRCLA